MNDELYIKNLGNIDTIYIKETRRHFLKPDFQYIYVYNIDEEEQTIVIPFKAAWNIDAEKLCAISKKYNIDFKIYAFEMGAQFNQDVEIIKGKIVKNEEITFVDYSWECIDPEMGG